MKAQISRGIVCLYVLLMVISCAHFPAGLKSEDTLRKKVHLEWDAKVGNNWGAVYDLSVKAFKDAIPRDNFIRRCNLLVIEFSIKEIKILEPGKKALATIKYKTNQMGFVFDMTAKEEWIWEDGKWCLNLSPSMMSLPFMNKN